MQLTPLQLQIQEYADKTLSFGCILFGLITYLGKQNLHRCMWSDGFETYMTDDEIKEREIIGHPMNFGRLCYLLKKGSNELDFDKRAKVIQYIDKNNIEYYQQTVLERPVELQVLVLKFLQTLPK